MVYYSASRVQKNSGAISLFPQSWGPNRENWEEFGEGILRKAVILDLQGKGGGQGEILSYSAPKHPELGKYRLVA